MTTERAGNGPREQRGTNWYRAYFVLALFDLLTVAAGLYLNHSIMALFTNSVQVNSAYALHLSDVSTLRDLAGRVNAPGNDVFDSRDVKGESARVDVARREFDRHLRHLRTTLPEEGGMASELAAIEKAMEDMSAEAREIFTFFANAQPTRAAERMATMDRKYAEVNAAISTADAHLRSQQGANLHEQQATASAYQRYEYVIGAMIVLMIICASLYGRRLHRNMLAAARERSRIEDELREARDAALDAGRVKSMFLANMSHEIRTPMNGVLGMAELMLQTTTLTPKQRRFVETIHRSGQGLLEVINDVLDYSKIEAGKLDLQSHSFDLRQIIEDALDLHAARAHAKALEVACRIPPAMHVRYRGDDVRIRQVINNLLGNAIKFTDRGEIVIRAEEQRDGSVHRVRVTVSDSGIGIAPENRARIFDAFAQADGSTTRKFGGTGLGLSICQRLVEMMGGSIGVDSEVGRGSHFWFVVPLEVESTAPASPAMVDMRATRILVVDDNATNREVLHYQLEAWGIAHEIAADAEEALALMAAASDTHFDIAIVDYQMPGMDGIELARRIRARAAWAATRLLILSSAGALDESAEAAAVGIDAVLEKPVRQSMLYDRLVSLVGLAGAAVPAAAGSSDTTGEAGQLQGRVLVAEDNPVNQLVARGMLEQLGVAVTVVADGAQAVAAVCGSSPPFDLVLMDMQMPELDGMEATAEIRRQQRRDACGRPLTIVALTANALPGDRERCTQAGMNDYLSKPYSCDELRAVLARWLPVADDALAAPLVTLDPASAELEPGVLTRLSELRPDDAYRLVGRFLDTTSRLLLAGTTALARAQQADLRRAAMELEIASASLGAEALRRSTGRLAQHAVDTRDLPSVWADIVAEQGYVAQALEAKFGRSGTEGVGVRPIVAEALVA